MKRIAVIPTRGRQRWCYNLCVQLLDQDTLPLVIDSNDPGDLFQAPHGALVYDYHDKPFNYSKACNIGLAAAESLCWKDDYMVAVLNDDIVLPPNFMHECEDALYRFTDAAVVFPDQSSVLEYGSFILDESPPGPVKDHALKMPGFAHVARGRLGVRFDDQMKIWYSDNDYEMQARQLGGTLMIGGLKVQHLDANGNFSRNPEWQEQAGHDRLTFKNKWGFDAW